MGRRSPKGPITFIAWGAVAGRPEELASAFGGEALCFFPPGSWRPPVPVRWALSAVATVVRVVHRRPHVVVVTNPPCPAALVGWAAARLVGARLVLDSHPGSFGAQGDRVAAHLQPLHRWVTRHADLSIVAADSWREIVESWGARALVLHEAPGTWRLAPVRRHGRLRVLYVGRFARDEPWQALLEAARRVPEVDVHFTGDPRAAGIDAGGLPPNVRLVGFLGPDRYREAVYDADLVVSLTTEPGSVMRAGCEAVWAGRPLVVSDWPAGREAFPFAVYAANDAESLRAALQRALDAYPDLVASAGAARRLQEARWEAHRAELLRQLAD